MRSSAGPTTWATTASGATVSRRYNRIRLRDASNETLKNSEPISEQRDQRVGEVVDACVYVSRRIDSGPTTIAPDAKQGRRLAVRPSADARATATSIAERGRYSADASTTQSSSLSAEMNTSPGTSTRPIDFIFFLPSFCFSSSLRLRVMSPP